MPVTCGEDIIAARSAGRTLARQLGFSAGEATFVATVTSELARDLLAHVGRGDIILSGLDTGDHSGITLVARDAGLPGEDIARVLADRHGFLQHLQHAQDDTHWRLDRLQIASESGKGTIITVSKWKR